MITRNVLPVAKKTQDVTSELRTLNTADSKLLKARRLTRLNGGAQRTKQQSP